MSIAIESSKRSTCDRKHIGAVIERDKTILSTGYNGSIRGFPHCDGIGHQMKATIHEDGKITNHCVRTTHAEQNAIVQAARNGARIEGSTLYCKMTPCYICAKMIINAGIKSVVVSKDYHAGLDSKKIFKQAGIKLKVVDKSVENYSNQ